MNVLGLLTRNGVTRIGVAGARAHATELFRLAAQQAEAETGGKVNLVWLSGRHGQPVDARIIVSGTAVERGKSTVEETVSLSGAWEDDLAAVVKTIITVLDKLT